MWHYYFIQYTDRIQRTHRTLGIRSENHPPNMPFPAPTLASPICSTSYCLHTGYWEGQLTPDLETRPLPKDCGPWTLSPPLKIFRTRDSTSNLQGQWRILTYHSILSIQSHRIFIWIRTALNPLYCMFENHEKDNSTTHRPLYYILHCNISRQDAIMGLIRRTHRTPAVLLKSPGTRYWGRTESNWHKRNLLISQSCQ
jgi:hypothetical protein